MTKISEKPIDVKNGLDMFVELKGYTDYSRIRGGYRVKIESTDFNEMLFSRWEYSDKKTHDLVKRIIDTSKTETIDKEKHT
jgi:hypothetical protein